MGLLDYADAARKKLAGLLGDMPLVQMAQGRAEMPTMAGVLGALKSMPVFSPDAGQSAYEAALNIGPMGLGKIVYHGSPHKFDKFDASKIGTGEGAQAYGHGIYLADSDAVAKGYQDSLTAPNRGSVFAKETKSFMHKGREILPSDFENWNAADIADMLNQYKVDLKTRDGKDWLNKELGARGLGAEVKKTVIGMLKDGVEKVVDRGALYKADLPDEWIPKMLDWDKPISQQPKEVVDGFRKMLKDQKYLGPNDNGPRQLSAALKAWKMERAGMSEKDSGNLFWEAMRDSAGGADKAAEYFRAAGVPGIRYLDGGSRGKGHGSYNYVVFPGLEDKVKILERNGVPLSGLLGGK